MFRSPGSDLQKRARELEKREAELQKREEALEVEVARHATNPKEKLYDKIKIPIKYLDLFIAALIVIILACVIIGMALK